MSNYDINLDDWYADAVDLKAQGMSNRGIARTLFSNENLRNRLNTFFQQETVIEDVYKRKAFYKEDSDIVLAATGVVRKETTEANTVWEYKRLLQLLLREINQQS